MNDQNLPAVSVIVVTRNRASSLIRTLQSLKKLDYPDYEIIVVDNASTDETKEVIAQAGATYVFSPPNNGIGATRQTGVDAASGTIVAFCDDDCVPSRGWLRHLVQPFLSDSNVGIVAGQVINVGFPEGRGYAEAKKNKGRAKRGRNGRVVFVEDPAEAEFFGNMNLAFRKEAIRTVGGYDPFFRVAEEIDLELRIKASGFKIVFQPDAVVEHHYTGIHFKARHLFYGQDLIRLYLCMKYFRPRSLKEWAEFTGVELRFLGRGMTRIIRKTGASIIRFRFGDFPSVSIETFNILSARLALPWIYWRANKTRAVKK